MRGCQICQVTRLPGEGRLRLHQHDVREGAKMERLEVRLRSERQRLGFDVAGLAGKAGIEPARLQALEAGSEQALATDLAALARAGVDVTYVLTGQGGAREAQLLANFRGAGAQGRSAVGDEAGASAPEPMTPAPRVGHPPPAIGAMYRRRRARPQIRAETQRR